MRQRLRECTKCGQPMVKNGMKRGVQNWRCPNGHSSISPKIGSSYTSNSKAGKHG